MPAVGRCCIVALVEVSCFACCCWIEGGATVTGSEAVWDVFVFRHLLHRYPVIEASAAGQGMMVEMASTTSLHTLVETQGL